MSESPQTSLYNGLRSLEWDLQSGTITVALLGGRTVSMLHAELGWNDDVIRCIVFTPAEALLQITTTRDEEVALDVEPLFGPPRNVDRPVVYLDQFQWSALAWHLSGARRITGPEAGPAGEIIRRAQHGEIIMPISSGHAVETSAQFAGRRQDLASTLLGLSRGWQMRNPIDVRKHEFSAVIAADPSSRPQRHDVFTPAAASLFTSGGSLARSDIPQDLPAQIERAVHLLSGVMATFAVLMDPQQEAVVKPDAWADHNNAIARDASFQGLSRERRRERVLEYALADVKEEVAEVAGLRAIAPQLASERISAALQGDSQQMPFFRLWTDVLYERLSNFTTRWESNDLIDMMFLGCAAAYADVVVAERKATNYLNTVWRGRQDRKCPVVRTLGEAVDLLEGRS